MKKYLCIELSYGWVLSRIDDSKFPIEMLKDKLLRASKFTVVSESYVHLTLEMDEKDVEKTKSKVTSFFTQKYGKDSIEALTFPIRTSFRTLMTMKTTFTERIPPQTTRVALLLAIRLKKSTNLSAQMNSKILPKRL